ncbi:ribonuclease HI [Candidatus Peregrinibacteria bacterium CG_4_9_14_0_2_um_filter_53_11]|nr:MAG: ribonuclease HI [Candidatus Peregrinibacteria bacterium CG_4_9_14_0_2_um_filter_53_11]
MKVAIYTDGSSLGNPGPGGFCALVTFDGKTKTVKGGAADTTNNRMEMSAIIAGLAWISTNLPEVRECAIYSDSNLIIQTIKQGWKRKKNTDLWAKMDHVIDLFDRLSWNWVKGHAGHPQNTEADRVAVSEAKKRQRALNASA